VRSTEPKNWKEAAEMLGEVAHYIPLSEAPPACAWRETEDSSGDPSEDLRRAEAPFLPAIEAAIRRFDIDKRLLLPSREIAYFVGLRVQVAVMFLASLSTHGPHESGKILAYPTGTSFLTIVEWLLLDWWRENGYYAAAGFQLLEECDW